MSQEKNYTFRRLPRHIGVIPDGNRRWALQRNMSKEKGYEKGLNPGLELSKICLSLGIEELTFYGFTHDNTKRPNVQVAEFRRVCVEAVNKITDIDASILVVGNYESQCFPPELLPYKERKTFGKGLIRVNFLINYDWKWDILQAVTALQEKQKFSTNDISSSIASQDISRVDMVVRWGGRRRLSGFLPVQAVYADFYIIDEYWPDYKEEHLYEALRWYETQDKTLGG